MTVLGSRNSERNEFVGVVVIRETWWRIADALSELVKLATARIVQEVLEREQHRPDWRIISGRSRRS